jgi:hypothetical protein
LDNFKLQGLQCDPAFYYTHCFLSKSEPPPLSGHIQSGFLGQLFFAYQLLDTLVWANGWPNHHDLCHIEPSSFPGGIGHMDTILLKLSSWVETSKIIELQLDSILNLVNQLPSEHRALSKGQLVVQDQGLAVKSIEIALQNFCQSEEYAKEQDKCDHLHQIFSVASTICLFSVVGLGLGLSLEILSDVEYFRNFLLTQHPSKI